MITAIRSNSLFNNQCSNIKTQHRNCTNTLNNTNLGDTVSFSGAMKAGKMATTRLSDESFSLIKKFSKELEPNKMYKFDPSNAEHFQLASVANKDNPEARNLYVQYSAYSNDNSAKYLMFSVNDSGEIFENGTAIKSKKDIALYENILPELITKASKELKLNIK